MSLNYEVRIELGNLLLDAGRTEEAQAQANAVEVAQPNNPGVHALLSAIAFRSGQKDQALIQIHRALELDPRRALFHENLAILQIDDPTKASLVEDELEKATLLEPKSLNPRVLLAALYARNGRLPEAEKTGWDAVAADPASIAARENVAQIILKRGDSVRAEQVLRQASKDFAGNPRGAAVLANYYFKSGQLNKAIAEYSSLIVRFPKNPNVQKAYVRVLITIKDFGTARSVVAGMTKASPKDPEVDALYGIALLGNDDAGSAVIALQQGARSFPKDANIRYWLGRAALAQGDTTLAEQSFLQAVELNPSAREAQEELAHLAVEHGDIGLLANVADKALAASPGFSDGYVWRAIVEINRDSADKGEDDLKTAMRFAPEDSQAYFQLGKLRFAQKRYSEGVPLLEHALEYNPNSVDALRLLVGYELYKKRPQKALARLNDQISRSPKSGCFYDLLAQLQIQGKNLDQAAVSADRALQLNSGDGEAVMLFAQIAVLRGQIAKAINTWERRSNEHPNDAGALAILGTLEEARGDIEKAEAYYKKSLQIEPQQPVAANNLAYQMLQRGETPEAALTLAQTARQGMPDSPSTADTLAWAYYCNGTYEPARDLLENAIATNPDSATMQYHLGMVYSKLQDKNNAIIHLKKAKSLAYDSQTAKDAKAALQKLS
jgi:Flp pilus assembly protein TadD